MTDTSLDDRGRLTLPKALRETYGTRFRIVELHDGIKLIPLPEDPLAALRSEFANTDATAAELRRRARKMAIEDAG